MTRYIIVDGVKLNPNKGFSIKLEDLSSSDSGRTDTTGTMFKHIVSQKWTVELSFTDLSDSNISTILKAVKTKAYVMLTFPNPLLGTDDTQEFYSNSPEIVQKGFFNDTYIWDLKLTFIQR